MRLTKNNDPRSHYYLVRCTICTEWVEHCDRAPIRAERVANKHARKHAGHESYVVDVTTLSVLYRYQFDTMIMVTDSNDTPPF